MKHQFRLTCLYLYVVCIFERNGERGLDFRPERIVNVDEFAVRIFDVLSETTGASM